jgi:hypothetical protein
MARRRHNHPEDVETERASWHEKKAKRMRAKRRRRKAWVEAELAGPSMLDESTTCGSISSQ